MIRGSFYIMNQLSISYTARYVLRQDDLREPGHRNTVLAAHREYRDILRNAQCPCFGSILPQDIHRGTGDHRSLCSPCSRLSPLGTAGAMQAAARIDWLINAHKITSSITV